MSRTVNLTSAGVPTTKIACGNKNAGNSVVNWQMEVMGAIRRIVSARIENYVARANATKSDTDFIGVACSSITATVKREDLKGALAYSLTMWSVIGWDFGSDIMTDIRYLVTELQCDVVLSSGGHDGHETMASATFKALHPVTGEQWHLVAPSDVQSYVRTCGCVAKQRGALGRTLDMIPKTKTANMPSVIVADRIVKMCETWRDNANGLTVARYGVSQAYALQHNADNRVVLGIRDKYGLAR